MYKSYRPQREADIKRALSGWIFRTARGIEAEAKRNVPRATGKLGQAIRAYCQYPISTVAVGPEYSRWVEGYPQATRRHFVPFEGHPAFAAWARRRGFDTSKGGLLVWGYATRFFQRAIETIKPKAQAELSQVKLR